MSAPNARSSSVPRNTQKLVAAVLVCATLLVCLPARAGDPTLAGGFDISPGAAVLLVVMGLCEAYLLVGGTTVAIGNWVYASRGEQSTPGWGVQGYLLGGLNLAIGALILCSGIDDSNNTQIALGSVQIGIGALDLGFTIWSSSHPKNPARRLSLSPIVMPDAKGNLAVGVNLQLVTW
jgi:hypothetical protein